MFDNAAAAAFGRWMFHDARLSANRYVACVTCHHNDRAWTDASVHAQGLAPVRRNTPALDNVAWQRRFGWTGASDSLWMANLRPLLDAREMGSSAAQVAQVVRSGIGLACRYRDAFGRDPATVDDLVAFLHTLSDAAGAVRPRTVAGRAGRVRAGSVTDAAGVRTREDAAEPRRQVGTDIAALRCRRGDRRTIARSPRRE